MCDIEQGKLGEKQFFKIILDSDIYIEKIIFNDNDIAKLNDKLFAIYVNALTEEFGEMLLDDETIWLNDIMLRLGIWQ